MNGMEMLNVKDTKNKYKKGKERKKKEKMFSSKKLKLKYVNIISICFFSIFMGCRITQISRLPTDESYIGTVFSYVLHSVCPLGFSSNCLRR